MASVTIVDLTDGSTRSREIPSGYLFHLHWMDLETKIPEGGHRWFRAVLDSFVDEILETEVVAQWRSRILTPVIVRAFYEANHFDPKDILTRMKTRTQLSGRVTVKHWEGFYFNHDMLSPIHREWWQRLKGREIERLSKYTREQERAAADTRKRQADDQVDAQGVYIITTWWMHRKY
jgi:hypothetical protein